MANLPLDPLVRIRDDGLQLSYQLPHRVYDAKSYPVQAPNGSSVIIYGHSQGIRVIWRGGRDFKPPREEPEPTEEPSKPNGTNDDAIMIIDSDEEDQPEPEQRKDTDLSLEFEDEEDEVDPTRPFQTILRYVDIMLGAKVLGLSVPCHQREETRSRLETLPPIMSSMIVLAAACGDGSIKLVALPLTPPAPTVKDSEAPGVQIVTLNEGLVQTVPTGVSLTFTRRKPDNGRAYRSQSRSRSGKSTPDSGSANAWDILLAVHSAEASGTLSIYQVPIIQQESSTSTYTFSTDSIAPLQHHYLASPATSISFNPCQYPIERHHHLLVTFANGCVKTYACLATKSRKPASERRSSVADIDVRETEGKWLLSLYPEFETDSTRRKTVVDAQWVLGGKAVIALLSDGTWGVWDIEGSGPGRKERSYLQSQDDSPAINGAVVKTFAVAGRVPGASTAPKPLLSAQSTEQKSTFMPMTPSTRRLREDTLFKGSTSGPALQSTRGGISVTSIGISKDGLADESIFIWHGDKNVRIPSLLSFWRSSIKPTGTFDPSSRSRPVPIENLNLFGEKQNGIDHLPHGTPSKSAEKHDILITAEHRLIILTPKATASEDQALAAAAQDDTITSQGDQLLLKRGQLDLEGMDRVLAGMASGSKSVSAIRSPQKRRIFS